MRAKIIKKINVCYCGTTAKVKRERIKEKREESFCALKFMFTCLRLLNNFEIAQFEVT